MSDHCLVLSTVASAEDGDRLARALVERRVAACVNVVAGVTSFYRWEGGVQRDEERLLVIKTRTDRFSDLRNALVDLHPYEVPEVIALPITGAHSPYLAWLDASVSR
ncbi:MAG TPA: divalent-cation tolerance protein CutA [Vicinamibacteria bacterium]